MNDRTEQWMSDVEQPLDYKAQGPLLDIVAALELRRDALGWSYAKVSRKSCVSMYRLEQVFSGSERMRLVDVMKVARAMRLEVRFVQ